MAFEDALTDLATIYTIAFTTDDMGQQTKGETSLYSNMPCRLHITNAVVGLGNDQGAFEAKKNRYTLMTSKNYNGANRGDKVVVNNETYIITKKHEIKGSSSEIHHVVYFLDEKN